ncbi:hypothetical protein [Paenibacillus sp. 276b]|uniref:hypothetical protein n=1 Tax=Paenibacillus sp. 276b TaxID=1566277 RepID=UPI00089501A0|nr:hypothetical protein [Paenibacillus sp. 276b]SEB27500.1 hypothetical protein SAMN03159332_6161 [Paenibacillus sp. 276b]
MRDEIEHIARLLSYDGPTATELIQEAVEKDSKYTVTIQGDITILTIVATLAYSLEVTDVYQYNLEGQLIKQTLTTNGKERTIFDKYKEAKDTLTKMHLRNKKVS